MIIIYMIAINIWELILIIFFNSYLMHLKKNPYFSIGFMLLYDISDFQIFEKNKIFYSVDPTRNPLQVVQKFVTYVWRYLCSCNPTAYIESKYLKQSSLNIKNSNVLQTNIKVWSILESHILTNTVLFS